MKKLIYILPFILISGISTAQQFPFMEGYNMDPFHLSPSYAGLINPNTISLDHRIDWAGIDGGPRTYQLSYHNRIMDKMGVGGRFIYDKSDIFKQMTFLGTYTYEVNVTEGHIINFGLSIGLFSNSIDLGKYFNDPAFIDDNALTMGTEKAKIKFTSDISALYRFNNLEAGIYFSSLMFGESAYENPDLVYKPLMNYLVHAAYRYDIDETWSVKPYLLLRGGQNAPIQVELLGHVNYTERIWGNLLFRSSGVFGIGFGGEVYNGIRLNYSYTMSSSVALNTFGGHQISLAFNLNSLVKGPSAE